MQMVRGEIERNKLPFNAESGRPWLRNAGPLRLDGGLMKAMPSRNASELPSSLRRPRHAEPIGASSNDSSIILIT
jgi:hypothetical protein